MQPLAIKNPKSSSLCTKYSKRPPNTQISKHKIEINRLISPAQTTNYLQPITIIFNIYKSQRPQIRKPITNNPNPDSFQQFGNPSNIRCTGIIKRVLHA